MSKKKKKYKYSIFLKLILAILIISFIIIYFLDRQSIKQNESIVKEETKEVVDEETNMYAIDFKKTENVKIDNHEKINTSEKLKEEKDFQGLTIKDIELKTDSGITKFTANIQNNTENDFSEKTAIIVFTNQDGTEYARLTCEIPSVNKGQTNLIDVKTTADIANAYDFKIIN